MLESPVVGLDPIEAWYLEHPDHSKRVRLAFRCSPAYLRWVDGLAASLRMTSSTVTERALQLLAAQVGFPDPPDRLAFDAGPPPVEARAVEVGPGRPLVVPEPQPETQPETPTFREVVKALPSAFIHHYHTDECGRVRMPPPSRPVY